MRVRALLPLLCLWWPEHAASQPDWARTCSAIGHFAEMVAAARDTGRTAAEASKNVQDLLNHPDILTPDVVAEVTRQIYATPAVSPDREAASVQGRCLTPTQAAPTPVWPAPDTLGPIKLRMGVNHIDTVEGTLDITLAWSNDSQGRGHDVFTAAMPGAGTVAMPDGDAVADDPANDQDMRRSVRFAQGRINGQDVVVLLTAQRDPGEGATRTVFQSYRLLHGPQGYRFGLMTEAPLPGTYCNADAALSAATGLPRRQSYRGPDTADGCPPRRNP